MWNCVDGPCVFYCRVRVFFFLLFQPLDCPLFLYFANICFQLFQPLDSSPLLLHVLYFDYIHLFQLFQPFVCVLNFQKKGSERHKRHGGKRAAEGRLGRRAAQGHPGLRDAAPSFHGLHQR